ncbi:MAG: hydratase [Burkholderiales bacterium RIFCSPHIGHO2_12_FULL_69_20]|nr:MAG: hydratase [Burkholderiales bacterium RIFCSPHIGHO2_12_FULL_69_20]
MTPQDLLHHIDSGEPWPAGAGAGFDDLGSAYQCALAVRALRVARGELPRGYKIGFTNRTIWPRYNVFAPIWGSMWNTSIVTCDGVGSVSLARTCQPRLEPEVVFGFKARPPADAGLDDLFDALDWVAPGFEIVQSHQPDWTFVAPQTVADSGLHARLLVGRKTPIAALAQNAGQLHHLLAAARVGLHQNGRRVEEGRGADVLDSPLSALLHFLTELRACPGATDVAAGDIVTTGTWTDAWPVRPGEHWQARFDAVLPGLEIHFE